MRCINNERTIQFSRKKQTKFPWSGEQVHYFSSGREAVLALILALSKEGGSVLLPAYVPEGLYAPFRQANWKIILYPIDLDMTPDWDFVENALRQRRPEIAVIIHYFGIPKPAGKFQELCRTYGTKVIEDRAHILDGGNGFSRAHGDFILYSLPKMIGVPDGALLVVRNPEFDTRLLRYSRQNPGKLYLMKQMILLVSNTILSSMPNAALAGLLGRINGKVFYSYRTLMKQFDRPSPMSKLSKFLLAHTDIAKITETRKKFSLMYRKRLDHKKFEHLGENYSIDHAMFGYPVLVDNRDSLVSFLKSKGIYGIVLSNKWDYLEYVEFGDTANIRYILDHHFIFPTAYHLESEQIEYVIDMANEWAIDHHPQQRSCRQP